QRIDAGSAARTEHFADDRLAAIVWRREAQHLDDDLVVRPRALGARIADPDRVGEHRAVDADVALAIALEVGADELSRSTFEHLDDFAARPETGTVWLLTNAHEHFVAGGGV